MKRPIPAKSTLLEQVAKSGKRVLLGKRARTIKPVRVSAALQTQYKQALQASNKKYKKIVNARIAKISADIEKMDRRKPGEFNKKLTLLQKRIEGLQTNLNAADKRSIKAVEQYFRKAELEHKRRITASFKRTMKKEKAAILIAEKQTVMRARTDKLKAQYIQSITSANRDYSDRVQAALLEKLVRPGIDVKKRIRKADGIVRRRIKNTVADQAHELNSGMNAVLIPALGSKKYFWKTQEDSRVRETHVERGRPPGNVYSWSRRPAGTGHPGEDHGCRCYAIPVIDQ